MIYKIRCKDIPDSSHHTSLYIVSMKENVIAAAENSMEVLYKLKIELYTGVPVMVQWLMNPNRNHEVAGLIPWSHSVG